MLNSMQTKTESTWDDQVTAVLPRISLSAAAAEMRAAQTLEHKQLRDVGSDEPTQVIALVVL
jgi:hypothetical protein